jgi:succinylglutamate desuccinylase
MDELVSKKDLISGSIYALSGNLNSLADGVRYRKEDLNRIWTTERMNKLGEETIELPHPEIEEQIDIYSRFQTLLKENKGPFYFMDLHTTSSDSIPFITVNDTISNREFTEQYPLPIILGIEEYLDGPMLSYINELGYVSFGFEAGQHDDLNSIENHISFVYLSLMFAGILNRNSFDASKHIETLLKNAKDINGFYEVCDQRKIKHGEKFKMAPGFENFQNVKKNQVLAQSDGVEIRANKDLKIFMPLYQDQGEDGYFIIRKIPYVFLSLSKLLRRLRIDNLLVLLPGIHWATEEKDTLIVNLRIAKFFAKQFFHLLGYRSKLKDSTHLILKNREAASKNHAHEYLRRK